MGNEESKSINKIIKNHDNWLGLDGQQQQQQQLEQKELIKQSITPPLLIETGVSRNNTYNNSSSNISKYSFTSTPSTSLTSNLGTTPNDNDNLNVPSTTTINATNPTPKPIINNLNNNSNGNGSGGSSSNGSNNSSNNSPSNSNQNSRDYTNISISNNTKDNESLVTDGGAILKTLKLIDKNRFLSTVKCSILGISGVGKTSFMRRFAFGEFLKDETTTIGGTRSSHTIHYTSISLNLEIWDIGGHDRLNGLLPYYIQGSNCILVMFDVTSAPSFRKAFSILGKTKPYVPAGTIFLLVANKVDSPAKQREVTVEQISKACQESEIPNVSWCEISARTGFNIHEPFQMISRSIMTMINALKSNQRLEKLNQSLTGYNNLLGSPSSTSSPQATTINNSNQNSPTLASVKTLNQQNQSNNSNNNYNTISNLQLVQQQQQQLASTANGSLPSLCEFDDPEDVETTNGVLPNISVPDIAQIRNNIYTCIERSYKPLPQPVLLKLETSKIIIEPTSNSSLFKLLTKKTFYFTNSSSSSSGNGKDQEKSDKEGSGETYCIIIDRLHPKRIELKKRGGDKSEVVMLCDYRDHLVKAFISLCPHSVPILEGTKSSERQDFIYTFKEYLKYFLLNNSSNTNIQLEQKLESQILRSGAGVQFNSLELSGVLRDEKLIMALSNSLLWNASVTHLDLSYNQLHQLDSRVFSELLVSINQSPSITSLDLTGNQLSSKQKPFLIEFIQSMKLKTLLLNGNSLQSSANLIIQSISQNSSNLLHLGFTNNQLNNDQALSISQMVQTNHTIQSIDLSTNKIDEKGALLLLKSLESKLNHQRYNYSITNLQLTDNNQISEKTILEINKLLIKSN